MIKAYVLLGAVAALLVPLSGASADSLAGQVGNKRYPVNFNNAGGSCPRAYKAYVGAAGHSAYAQTPSARVNFICGVAINARSAEAAEQQAMRNCEAGLKKFKINSTGRCSVYVSK